jgi:hypothetical protein
VFPVIVELPGSVVSPELQDILELPVSLAFQDILVLAVFPVIAELRDLAVSQDILELPVSLAFQDILEFLVLRASAVFLDRLLMFWRQSVFIFNL